MNQPSYAASRASGITLNVVNRLSGMRVAVLFKNYGERSPPSPTSVFIAIASSDTKS